MSMHTVSTVNGNSLNEWACEGSGNKSRLTSQSYGVGGMLISRGLGEERGSLDPDECHAAFCGGGNHHLFCDYSILLVCK